MTEWRTALEAGINKAWGGNNPTGYSGTVDLVALVDHILHEAGYTTIRSDSWRLRSDFDVVPHFDAHQEIERLRAALLHQIGGCCFCDDCDATYAHIDGEAGG